MFEYWAPVLFDTLMMEQGSEEDRGKGAGGTRGEHEQAMRSCMGLEEKMCSHGGELRLCLYLINEWH